MPSVKITVIGAGPGGYVAALRAAQLGAEVTLIEKDNVGGTCLNWGCIPSKVLKHTAETLEKINRSSNAGIILDSPARLDLQQVMTRKKTVVDGLAGAISGLLARHKINLIRGEAYLEKTGLVSITTSENISLQVPWDRLIISTGSVPLPLPAFPFDGSRILSSNDVLVLECVPESVLIIGGGVIGCEFAGILSAFGSTVTIVEALSRLLPLPMIDEDCSKILQREMKKRKVAFLLNRTVKELQVSEAGVRAMVAPADTQDDSEKAVPVDVEKVVVCIGRRPNSASMNLHALGVDTTSGGWIKTDEKMQTSCPDVYAVGDILGPDKIMLAHVASHEGMIAAENAMGASKKMNYDLVPSAVFTIPEVASVGLSESLARDRGFPVRSDSVWFRSLGKSHVIEELAGSVKMISNDVTGQVVGVHIIGPHATDLIGEATLAIKMGATAEDIAETIHAHPTLCEIMGEVSLKAVNRPIHG